MVELLPVSIRGFVLERQIGSGGGGVVYAAKDRKQGKSVAIKVATINGSRADTRFEREISMMRELSTRAPGTVPDFITHGTTRTHRWYAMELVDGGSLQDLIQSGHFQRNPSEVVKVAYAIQFAMLTIHSLGFVHRDLKPQNIIWTGERAVVIDFGIARSNSEATVTTNFFPHSLGYASPEQMSGRTENLTVKSDVFSLGCLFAKLVGGAPLYKSLDQLMMPADPQTARKRHEMLKDAAPTSSSARVLGVLGARSAEHIIDRIAGAPNLAAVHQEAKTPLTLLIAAMCAKQPSHRPSDELVLAALSVLASIWEPGTRSKSTYSSETATVQDTRAHTSPGATTWKPSASENTSGKGSGLWTSHEEKLVKGLTADLDKVEELLARTDKLLNKPSAEELFGSAPLAGYRTQIRLLRNRVEEAREDVGKAHSKLNRYILRNAGQDVRSIINKSADLLGRISPSGSP